MVEPGDVVSSEHPDVLDSQGVVLRNVFFTDNVVRAVKENGLAEKPEVGPATKRPEEIVVMKTGDPADPRKFADGLRVDRESAVDEAEIRTEVPHVLSELSVHPMNTGSAREEIFNLPPQPSWHEWGPIKKRDFMS